MATRSSGSSRNFANTAPIARLVAASMALAFGRSSSTSRTAPSRRTRTGAPGMGSGTQGPKQLARDDVPLDLARAIPDALDASVAPEPLQRQFVHQPHAAEDLDRPVSHAGE